MLSCCDRLFFASFFFCLFVHPPIRLLHCLASTVSLAFCLSSFLSVCLSVFPLLSSPLLSIHPLKAHISQPTLSFVHSLTHSFIHPSNPKHNASLSRQQASPFRLCSPCLLRSVLHYCSIIIHSLRFIRM